MGTGPRCQLDGEPADPAGGPGDQHPLVRPEPGGPQRAQCRHSGDRQSDRLRQIQALGHLGKRTPIDRDALGERPRGQRHHPGTHRRTGVISSGPHHHPGGIRTEHRAHRDAAGAGVV